MRWPTLPLFLVLTLHCQAKRMNVLFLVSDDMRPQLGAYQGDDFPSPVHPTMVTPNLDKLASKSMLMKRSYVQVALCSPSRTSLLTGRRPETSHVYDIGPYFRKVGGNFTTLPQHFKLNGYETIGMGKVFHPGRSSGGDDPISWTMPYYHPPYEKYWDGKPISWMAVDKKARKKRPLPDDDIARRAIKTLQAVAPLAKSGKKNFFLAAGFRRPHLPYVVPEEYLSYYPNESVHVPPNQFAPVNMPDIAWLKCPDLFWRNDVRKTHASGQPNTTFPANFTRELRRAYYSAITYVDDLIGGILNELDRLGLANNTIVSFWGDHGYQLGEHGLWCKQTCFELATHAPMMVRIPGLTDRGVVVEKVTEFIDLFPTLVEAAGLTPAPLCPPHSQHVDFCHEGSSWMPLLTNSSAPWKNRVFSQNKRGKITKMGYTMRNDRYRYTEWVTFDLTNNRPNWEENLGVELYDHQTDSEENYNVADNPDLAQLVKMFSTQLREGWRAALPK